MIWLQLLYVYLKIGILGFGGGYAMLSLIQPTWWTAMVGFPCRSLPILSLSLK